MFRASLCPSSGDRLYKTASGVSLDVLAADCVESGHELSAQCEAGIRLHLYLCHMLVLSSPTLMMHGHTNLKLVIYNFCFTCKY